MSKPTYNEKKMYTFIELAEVLRYEIKKHKENISNINIFLHDISCNTHAEFSDIYDNEHVQDYCSSKKEIEALIEKKSQTLLNVEKVLFDCCNHNWCRDCNESPLYTNVKITPFKTCSYCSITVPI